MKHNLLTLGIKPTSKGPVKGADRPLLPLKPLWMDTKLPEVI